MNPNDLAFDPAEGLYRRVAADQLRKGKLKPNALRPQFSVARSKYAGVPNDVPPNGKFNGVVEITVAQVRTIRGVHLNAHCVYEPLLDDTAHSLIALTTEVSSTTALDEDFEKVRAAIANAMTVRRLPT